jgi:hypothetical protein
MASLTFSSALLMMAETARADQMDDLAWSARPIIVFAATADDPRAAEQLELLNRDSAALSERDIVVIAVWPDQVRSDADLDVTPESLRTRYGIEAGTFAVLLVGKDTGVKRRADNVVSPDALYSQIDSMPMRQREMRRQ